MFVGIGLRRTYRKAKNLVWQFEVMGHERSDDNTWHELRKSAKALGYQLRLLKPIWPKMMNVSVDEIDQLTDHLGDANDLAILRAKILNEPYDPSETQESAEIRGFSCKCWIVVSKSCNRRPSNWRSWFTRKSRANLNAVSPPIGGSGRDHLKCLRARISAMTKKDAQSASTGKRKQKLWYPYLYHRRLRQS